MTFGTYYFKQTNGIHHVQLMDAGAEEYWI